MRNLRPSQRASHLLHHLVPQGQPQLQFPHRLLLLLPIALEQVPPRTLSLHRHSVRRQLLRQQGLPQPQTLVLLNQLLRLLSHYLPLQGFKLLATQGLTRPQLDLLQPMPLLAQ